MAKHISTKRRAKIALKMVLINCTYIVLIINGTYKLYLCVGLSSKWI